MKKDLIVSIFLSLFLILFIAKNTESQLSNTKQIVKKEEIKLSELKYGLPIDSFKIQDFEIQKDEFLSQILGKFGVEYKDVMMIVENSDTIFDVRNMKRGNKYTVFSTKDSISKIQYFIYEQNLSDYVVFDFTQDDGVLLTTGQKQIDTIVQTVSGDIQSSLWEALTDHDINPLLANELSEIYAWTIDFFALQKGDRFKAYYEELFVEGQSIGFGKILATEFQHLDTSTMAFLYQQDSTENYFDEQGNSLKKAFLKAPLKYSRISSGFSYSRLHPVDHVRKPHLGIDYAAPRGTPVMSIGEGTVTYKAYSGAGGNMVKIKHNGVYTTAYLHLRGFAKGLYVGKRVNQSEVIGYVGATGKATGPHLDFRVWMNGKNINPLTLKSPPVAPISEEDMAKYHESIEKYKQILENIPYPEAKDHTVAETNLVASLN